MITPTFKKNLKCKEGSNKIHNQGRSKERVEEEVINEQDLLK